MEFKENVLDTIVYTLHFQRFSIAAAHTRLVDMVGPNSYTIDDIAAIYGKIDEKKFSLKKNGEEFDVDMVAGFPEHLNEMSKQNSINAIIKVYHAKGHTALAAYEKLMKLAGDKSYTLTEVEALYKKIDGEEHNGKLKVDCITDFPEHLHRKIIEELDITGRAALRKTCHLYRDFVNDVRCHIKTLDMRFDYRFVKLTDNEHFDVSYKQIVGGPNNHVVECKNGTRTEEGDFLDTALSDLKTILTINNLHFDELIFRYISLNLPQHVKFLQTLESLEKKLKVETIIAAVDVEGTEFSRVLQSLDVDTIKTIKTCGSVAVDDTLINCVCELPQWKAAKRFEGQDLGLDTLGFANTAHFETFFLKLSYEDVTVEHMMVLKDRLLLNHSVNQFKIRHVNLRETIERLLDAIQPFKCSATSFWAYFNYPNSKDKLALCVTNEYIWFKGPCFVEEPELGKDFRWPEHI